MKKRQNKKQIKKYLHKMKIEAHQRELSFKEKYLVACSIITLDEMTKKKIRRNCK